MFYFIIGIVLIYFVVTMVCFAIHWKHDFDDFMESMLHSFIIFAVIGALGFGIVFISYGITEIEKKAKEVEKTEMFIK